MSEITPEMIIERNWEEVKSEMRKKWRNLTEDQVAKISNYDDLVEQLKKAYKITDDSKIIEKINEFIDKFDLQPNLTMFEEYTRSFLNKASDAKEKVADAVKSSTDTVKEKAGDWSQHAVNYSKENPMKVLGLGVLAAVAIKKLIDRK